MADVLATSFPINRLKDVLALAPGEKREAELRKLREEYPS